MRAALCVMLASALQIAIAQGPEPVSTRAVMDETVELQPLGTWHWSAENSFSARIQLTADSAVFLGIFPTSKLQQLFQQGAVLRSQEYERSKCGRIGVVKTTINCEIDAGETLLIRDKRAEGTQLLGMFGAIHPNSQLVERAVRPNRLTIAIYRVTSSDVGASTITAPRAPAAYIWMGIFDVAYETPTRGTAHIRVIDTLGIYQETEFESMRAAEVDSRRRMIREQLVARRLKPITITLVGVKHVSFPTEVAAAQ